MRKFNNESTHQNTPNLIRFNIKKTKSFLLNNLDK
jgi:hypothetical protein